ncbi:hypothetical protein QNX23_003930 [Cronobacter sakazakii]|nr:hypothetical protein [Cronobacter sakazakii]
MNNDELIAAGHGLAKCLDSEPLLDIAKMIVRLADKLDVTTAALRERAEPVATLYKSGKSAPIIITFADLPDGYTDVFTELQTAPPAPVVPDGLRMALSNAGIAAPESDEVLWASQQDYIQALVTWVKDRKPFKPAPVVPVETFEEWSRRCEIQLTLCRPEFREVAEITWNACRAAMLAAPGKDG